MSRNMMSDKHRWFTGPGNRPIEQEKNAVDCCSIWQSSIWQRFFSCVAVACLIIVVSGCSKGDGFERVVVSGNITYQGKPVQEGTIEFVPDAKTNAPVSGTTIQDGIFKADRHGGVAVGNYKVAILAFKTDMPTNVKNPSPFTAMAMGQGEQYIPAKYNKNTELKLSIPSGGSSVTQDYKLTD